MSANEYHFITHWHVPGTVQEVGQVIADAQSLVRWWPSVYLDVQEVEPGNDEGVGKVIDLYTKGWLPYTLRWRFRVTEVDDLKRIALEAEGDFVGRGIWTLSQEGAWVDVTYDWNVRAEKPMLRRFSFLLKPIFSANHRWAMAKGEESLKLELARRHAQTLGESARVPPPPGPTTTSSMLLPLVMLGGTVVVYKVVRKTIGMLQARSDRRQSR
jgi:hypothetical protein